MKAVERAKVFGRGNVEKRKEALVGDNPWFYTPYPSPWKVFERYI